MRNATVLLHIDPDQDHAALVSAALQERYGHIVITANPETMPGKKLLTLARRTNGVIFDFSKVTDAGWQTLRTLAELRRGNGRRLSIIVSLRIYAGTEEAQARFERKIEKLSHHIRIVYEIF